MGQPVIDKTTATLEMTAQPGVFMVAEGLERPVAPAREILDWGSLISS